MDDPNIGTLNVELPNIFGARRSRTWKASKTRRREMGNCNASGWADDPPKWGFQPMFQVAWGDQFLDCFSDLPKSWVPTQMTWDPSHFLQICVSRIPWMASWALWVLWRQEDLRKVGPFTKKTGSFFRTKMGILHTFGVWMWMGLFSDIFLPVWGMFDVGHRLTFCSILWIFWWVYHDLNIV